MHKAAHSSYGSVAKHLCIRAQTTQHMTRDWLAHQLQGRQRVTLWSLSKFNAVTDSAAWFLTRTVALGGGFFCLTLNSLSFTTFLFYRHVLWYILFGLLLFLTFLSWIQECKWISSLVTLFFPGIYTTEPTCFQSDIYFFHSRWVTASCLRATVWIPFRQIMEIMKLLHICLAPCKNLEKQISVPAADLRRNTSLSVGC